MRNTTRIFAGLFSAALVATLGACEQGEAEGILPAPAGGGPRIVFDLLARPLPEIPFPNDLATRLDVDAPTGRRVNASLSAPTLLEEDVRREFNLLDGFGTFSPMTVGFEGDIDAADVRARHANDDWTDDAIYLVNLTNGEAVPLDLGRGNFPVVLQNNDKFFKNDPRDRGSNLLFETYDEDRNGNGLLDEGEDTDHDGLLDRPNTWDPSKPLAGVPGANSNAPVARGPDSDRGNDVYRDLMGFYERETHTLIIRPVVTLDQRTTYAAVITTRLKGTNGQPVTSPFPFVNHASQTEPLRPLLGFLSGGAKASKALAGLAPNEIAFTWTFTTQSVTKDLEAIQDGLHGKGTLAWLADQVSEKLEPVKWAEPNAGVTDEPLHPVRDRDTAENRFIVPLKDFATAFGKLVDKMGVEEGPDINQLLESYKFVDYFVVGSFRTANFLDDPEKPTFDAVFRVNAEKGLARVWQRPPDAETIEEDAVGKALTDPISDATSQARQAAKLATRDRVWFMLAVPKAINGHTAPFPVSIYGHGYTSSRVEFLGFAGNLAKFGIASVAIDSYGHGLDLEKTERAAISAIVGQYGFSPLMDAIFKSRARDLDNDGIDNSGGDFWVADTFHTRDVVRQSIVDWMQLARVFHAFGTYEMGNVDGKGGPEIAGDFNADGTVDVGGPEYPDAKVKGMPADRTGGARNPGYDFFAWGQSLGGILAGILPAVEPSVAAAAPVAGGAGLSDIGIRSEQGGVIQAVFMEILGPLLVSEPVDASDLSKGAHLAFQVQDVNDDRTVRMTPDDAPLKDLRPGDKIVVHNRDIDNGEDKDDFAIVPKNGVFRLHIAADNASFRDGAKVNPADPKSYLPIGKCQLDALPAEERERVMSEFSMRHGADCIEIQIWRRGQGGEYELLRTIDRWPREVTFQQRRFQQGAPLVALARGFGMKRGHHTFRRFMSLAQTILEPGDPANYAAHYAKDLLDVRRKGGPDQKTANPAGVLVIGTIGDLNVPVNTAFAQARIAGALPWQYDAARDAAWGMSPNDVVIRSKAMECIEKLEYYRPVQKASAAAQDLFGKPLDALTEEQRSQVTDGLSAEDRDLANLVTCARPEDCGNPSLVDLMGYAYDARSRTYLDSGNSTVPMRYGGAPRLRSHLRDVAELPADGYDAQGRPAKRKVALVAPYLDSHGKHGFDVPHPQDPFDIDTYMINLIGRFFQSRGTDLRYDLCMHRDGYDRKRLVGESRDVDPAARRVSDPGDPGAGVPRDDCSFIPEYPLDY